MRLRTHGSAMVGCFLAITVAACAGEGGQAGEEDAAPGETSGSETMAATAAPDTTAAALWSHMEEASYRESWQLWPDKGELYEGGEPHGMLLTTYLNSPAYDAVSGEATALPAGAIVVKENYMPDSTLAAVTVMYKAEGYDAEHNDWFWVKYDPDGSVANDGKAAGRVPGCIKCHGGAADNDYIMTATLGGGS